MIAGLFLLVVICLLGILVLPMILKFFLFVLMIFFVLACLSSICKKILK